MLIDSFRNLIGGVSWQNPVVSMALHTLDPLDWLIREIRDLEHLPRYSVRVRSNGVRRQFGGRRFAHFGQVIGRLLKEHAGLVSTSQVLEIGCGCGRTAIALAADLDDARYTGVDIEKVSLNACRENRYLAQKTFNFDHLDVQNDVYNPNGGASARYYNFPFSDAQFDIIFLTSVFTHMLSDDVANYIKEISRMLKKDGRCMLTTFLMDFGIEGKMVDFQHVHGRCRVYNSDFPEIAVGYYQDFFESEFGRYGLSLIEPPLLGPWRPDHDLSIGTEFPQDVLLFGR